MRGFLKKYQRSKTIHNYIKKKIGMRSSEEWDAMRSQENNLNGAFFDNDDASVVFHKLLAVNSNFENLVKKWSKDFDIITDLDTVDFDREEQVAANMAKLYAEEERNAAGEVVLQGR